jgi:hypothetical protein
MQSRGSGGKMVKYLSLEFCCSANFTFECFLMLVLDYDLALKNLHHANCIPKFISIEPEGGERITKPEVTAISFVL